MTLPAHNSLPLSVETGIFQSDLSQLKSKLSYSPFKVLKKLDRLAVMVYNSLYMVVFFYLTFTINTYLTTGVLPQAWKYALVIPLFKKGDQESVNNYRPISLLPILLKIDEKMVTNQLLDDLLKHKLLSNSQHGFTPNISTETALQKITNTFFFLYRNWSGSRA